MNKTAMITGATSGFGKATAELFAQNGYDVVITGRRRERLDSIRKQLEETAKVHAVLLDVSDRNAVRKAAEETLETFGSIDVLVNNAGLALGLEPAHRADLSDWEEMVDTNIKGLMYCTRALLPAMAEKGSGHIVNIGSIAGTYPYPGGNAYGATKAFVKQFSRNLRADLAGTGIKVTNIEPGLAETEFSIVRFKGDRDKAAKVYENTQPLVAEDIAQTVFWVVSAPSHVNINSVEIMPVCQAWGPLSVNRKEE